MYGEVRSTRWVTPGLVRVELGGDGLAGFEVGPETDSYVNVAIPPPGAPYGPVFDVAEVRDRWPAALQPRRRRYTVRRWDPATRTLWLDVVVHGDSGAGGPWAAHARPGDVLVLTGPGGGYRPDPAADWHLMVGDESALPAVAASLEAVPPGAPVVVRLVCDGTAHELDLDTPGRLDLRWLHRTGAATDPLLLVEAVRGLAFQPGRPHAFVHGEADEVRALRRHLLVERGIPRAEMSCSPYWRRTMDDEAWRTVKKQYVAAMEAEAQPVS